MLGIRKDAADREAGLTEASGADRDEEGLHRLPAALEVLEALRDQIASGSPLELHRGDSRPSTPRGTPRRRAPVRRAPHGPHASRGNAGADAGVPRGDARRIGGAPFDRAASLQTPSQLRA